VARKSCATDSVGWPFDGRDNVTWLEAVQVPLCLLTGNMQNRKTIDAVFAELNCKATPTLESNSIISMLAHVCSGEWSAIYREVWLT